MTAFAAIARTLHRAERWFAGLHTRWWLWRNREMQVTLEIKHTRVGSDKWVPRTIHDADWEPPIDSEHRRMEQLTLEEARERGGGICESCFPNQNVNPLPY